MEERFKKSFSFQFFLVLNSSFSSLRLEKNSRWLIEVKVDRKKAKKDVDRVKNNRDGGRKLNFS